MVSVALAQGMLQERRAIAFALVDRVNADERQVPVGLMRMIAPHLLEDGEHGRLPLCRHACLQDCRQGLFVRMDARAGATAPPRRSR